jgi:hypothetical protein
LDTSTQPTLLSNHRSVPALHQSTTPQHAYSRELYMRPQAQYQQHRPNTGSLTQLFDYHETTGPNSLNRSRAAKQHSIGQAAQNHMVLEDELNQRASKPAQ